MPRNIPAEGTAGASEPTREGVVPSPPAGPSLKPDGGASGPAPPPVEPRDAPESSAFEALHERVRAQAMEVCRQILHDADLAAEALQEACIDLLRHLRRGARIKNLEAWFVEAARLRALRLSMRLQRREHHEEAVVIRRRAAAKQAPSPLDLATLSEMLARIEDLARDRLTPRQKEVLLARLAGWTIPDIARRLRIAEGAVQQHLARIRERLHPLLRGFM